MPILGLNHVGLSTPDLPRLQRFYCDLLGMPTIGAFSWEAGNAAADAGLGLTDTAADVLLINAGNCFLEAFHWRNPVGRPRSEPSFGPLTWEVVDADAVRAAAREVGCEVAADGSFLDPAGVRTVLISVADPASADGGSSVVHRLRSVGLGAREPEITAAWWADVTEVTLYRGVDGGSGDRICDLGANHLCIDVTDIDAVHAELTARGMHSHTPPARMPGGHAAVGYGWDPFGNAVELLESYDADAALSRHRLTRT
jgi:catechol 2,3-dioxygenase-like lactoylglutathione lyase family enzyme